MLKRPYQGYKCNPNVMHGFVHLSIFTNCPCIHTRYILSCLFRFTSSLRSTPRCLIENSGWKGKGSLHSLQGRNTILSFSTLVFSASSRTDLSLSGSASAADVVETAV